MMRFQTCRWLLPVAVLGLLSSRAWAQPALPDMPIPVPAGAQVQFEVDARQDDVLGMLKSVIKGASETLAKMPKPTASPSSPETFFMGLLSDTRLQDAIKDIHHVRFVMFVPKGKLDLKVNFEEPWSHEGGHRISWADMNGVNWLVYGFDQPHGFGAVMVTSEMVIAVRSDGYPNMEALAPLLGALVLQGKNMAAPQPPVAVKKPVPVKKP